jgi:hypothetical protein
MRILVDSFTGKLGRWASDNASLIHELNTISAFGAFMKVNYVINEDLAAAEYFNLLSLIELDQHSGSLLEYTRAFNRSYEYWNNDISLKTTTILYIKVIKSVALSTKLWFN